MTADARYSLRSSGPSIPVLGSPNEDRVLCYKTRWGSLVMGRISNNNAYFFSQLKEKIVHGLE